MGLVGLLGPVGLVDTVHREFSIPGVLVRISLIFFSLDHEKWFSISRSRLETRDWYKSIPALVSKNEIFIQISWEKIHIILRKIKKWEKTSKKFQNSCENCGNWFSFSSQSPRLKENIDHSCFEAGLKEQNSCSCLEIQDWKKEIPVPLSDTDHQKSRLTMKYSPAFHNFTNI